MDTFYGNVKPQSAPQKRVFFRIPAKLGAKVFLKEGLSKDVRVFGLSAVGLSFDAKEINDISDSFELHLKLSSSAKPIKIKAQLKHKSNITGGLRVGCSFLEISPADQQLIENYINHFVDISLPPKILSIAAYLCFVDALCRICAFTVSQYYLVKKLGINITFTDPQGLYFTVLIGYAFFASFAFMIFGPVQTIKSKWRFLSGLCVMVPLFIFIMAKNIVYVKFGLWHCSYSFMNYILYTELLLVISVGFAIYFAIISLKRINMVLAVESLEMQRRAICK